MLIDDCEIRKFFESHCDAKLSNELDLDTLVIKYQQTKDERDYANLCNKALFVIFGLIKTCKDELDKAEIYSQSFEALLRATEKWQVGKVKFLTYYYACLFRVFCNLRHKKSVRDYLKYFVSLNDLIENTNYDKTIIEDNSFIFLRIKCRKGLEQNIIDFIKKYNVVQKTDIAKALNITVHELDKNIKRIQERNKDILNDK